MPITVVISKDGIVHGTDNGKKTGCGIKYNTGDNLRNYKQGEVLTDLIMAMKTLNCEKCRRVLSSKMIKEDRKAENKREKKEKKRIAEDIKRGELDADGNPIVSSETEQETSNESVQEIQNPTPSTPNMANPLNNNSPLPVAKSTVDVDISQYLVDESPAIEEHNEPTPVAASTPSSAGTPPVTDDINDIFAELDALMSNISTKGSRSTEHTHIAEKSAPPVLEDFASVQQSNSVKEVTPPVLEDFAPVQQSNSVKEVTPPVLEDFAPVQQSNSVKEVTPPVLEDFAPVQQSNSVKEVTPPVLEDFAPVQQSNSVKEVTPPVLEDFAPVQQSNSVKEVTPPVLEDFAPVQQSNSVKEVTPPVLEDFAPVQQSNPVKKVTPSVLEDFAPVQQTHTDEKSTPPVLEDFAPVQQQVDPIVTTTPTPTAPIPVVPAQTQSSQGFTQSNSFNGYQQPTPQPAYVQPTPPIQPMPQYYYNAYGEAIPITYNAQNQPVFTIPVTYDAQGQPRPMQINQPTMPIPQPSYVPQPQPQQTYVQPQPTVVQPSATTTPPPTRIVRADAPSLISKPSENKPFDFSVFENENKKPVFMANDNKVFVDSIEEALNQLGVETDIKKEDSNDVTIEYQEYVPTKSTPKPKNTQKPVEHKQELSEAERKKREKMDAKLRKEWEKKGLDPNAWKRMRH